MTDQAVVAGEATEAKALANDHWAVWQALTNAFGFWRLLRHLITSKSGMGIYEIDVVSSLKATPMGRAAQPVLAQQSDSLLTKLLGLARINAKRNDAMWKFAALFYISGPTTLILAGFQIAPKLTRTILAEGHIGFLAVFVGMAASLLHYYSINWRAAQLEALIELEMVERGLTIPPV